MCAHAVAIPLNLTDPAPLVVAAGAVHMHAAARTFRCRSALWARLREHFDGNVGGFVPLGVGDAIKVHRILATAGVEVLGRRRMAFADVEALMAIFAEHILEMK